MPLRAVLAACLALSAADAAAQSVCGDRTQIVRRLADAYGEVRRGGGVGGPKVIFELFASPETGSWTLLATRPEGRSCVVAVGESWRDLDDAVEDPPA